MEDGLSALSLQVGMAVERLRTVQRDQDGLRKWAIQVDKKVRDLERAQKRPKAGDLLREIASPREWAMALAVTVLALWGIITPEDIRDLTRSTLGLEQRALHAPG